MESDHNDSQQSTADEESMETSEEEYGDLHKIILQGIMGTGILDAKAVKTLFTSACDFLKMPEEQKALCTSMEYVQKVVRRINDEVKEYNLTVKSAFCELTGKKYFLFLPTVEKSIAQFQQQFSSIEVDMFKICMDRILRKYNNFAVPLAECINVLREVDRRAPIQKGADFVQQMIDCQYFTKYMVSKSDYHVTMGVRGLREFEPLLVDKYGDVIHYCMICHTLLLHAYRCPKCKGFVHKACYMRYVKQSPACKDCGLPWLRDKDMLRRSRTIDEIIEAQGKNVDVSQFKKSGPSSQSDSQADSQTIEMT